ncbi:MAG: helix-turn-helix transcriptional regulator [Flavobacteriaceae bacterium]
MLNKDSFIKRLEELMDDHQLSAAAFAQKIGVQRSSVSHILSKRNKPSLEFMLKIHHHFTEVDLDWLLLGKDKNIQPPSTPSLPQSLVTQTEQDLTSHIRDPSEIEIENKISIKNSDKTSEEVIQIIQIYKDGSFRSFFPKS